MIQKEKTERRRKGRGRIAAVLAAVLMVTAVSAVTAFADIAVKDLNNCAVSVSLPSVDAGDTSFDEIGAASVVLDFYQVMPAVDLKGFDAYEFGEMDTAFNSCKTEWEGLVAESKERTLTAGELNAFTQHLASVVLDSKGTPGTKITSTDKLNKDGSISVTVPGGMYLVLARSSEVTDVKEYSAKTTSGDQATYATKADGETKRYLFAPMLVTAPVRESKSLGSASITAGEEQVNITIPAADSNTAADRGDWAEAASLVVKVGVTDLDGSLKITKNLLNHESMWNRTDKATFIYRIESDKYKGAESIVFEAGGSTKSVVVDHIPVGATVTVTEIYTGGDYSPVGESQKTVTITPVDPVTKEPTASVEFTNEHNGGHNGGGSVKNTYGTTSSDDGITWTWSNTPVPSYADDTSIR